MFKVSTILMGDREEDFDDFPTFSTENMSRQAEFMVGAYRAEPTHRWTCGGAFRKRVNSTFFFFCRLDGLAIAVE